MKLSHCFLFFILFFSRLTAQDPDILYLTWKGDPATTMTVMWHTRDGNGPSLVQYQRPGNPQWLSQEGSFHRLKKSSVTIHQVELKNLEPDTEYAFRLEGGDIHRLRTMPDGLTRPIRAVVGGDAYFSKELYEKMNREVASKDPDFVIMAGDIAYTEGLSRALCTRYWKINRWEEFFLYWSRDMVTKDGRLIPILPVLGNHDVFEGFDDPHKSEVLFYQFFVFPKENIPYWVFSIGRDLSFYLLDSCHSYPINGAQTEWLEGALQERQDALYRIPVYHIAGYPSVTSYTHRGARDIRKFWVPLFEKYGVKISMEHDNHAFKRTFPIWQGRVDPKGVQYLGDGAWGVFPDGTHYHWYLAKVLETNCYWLLTINKDKLIAEAFDNTGELIDELEINP